MAGFQSLPGFRDFYPEDFSRRQHIFRLWRQNASAFGFQEYDAPVLEPLELYKTKSGDEIEAQLFSFKDKGDREVSLRPEMTPTVCRMVGARAGALKRPIKWFSIGEFYRYERAQKGRLRAFHQFNADIFGEAGPEAEIELIALLIQCLAGFGLTKDDFTVRLPDKIAEESRGLSRSVFMLLLGLAGIGAVVGAMVIGLVTQQAVKSRQGEIGIRRAMGAMPSDILQQIASESIMVSVLGGVVGLALGLAAAWGLARSQQLAFGFDALVLAGPLVLILIAAVAGLIPARSASRLDPAVALRSR